MIQMIWHDEQGGDHYRLKSDEKVIQVSRVLYLFKKSDTSIIRDLIEPTAVSEHKKQ